MKKIFTNFLFLFGFLFLASCSNQTFKINFDNNSFDISELTRLSYFCDSEGQRELDKQNNQLSLIQDALQRNITRVRINNGLQNICYTFWRGISVTKGLPYILIYVKSPYIYSNLSYFHNDFNYFVITFKNGGQIYFQKVDRITEWANNQSYLMFYKFLDNNDLSLWNNQKIHSVSCDIKGVSTTMYF